MRTNNGKVKNLILSIYFILIILTIAVTAFAGTFQNLFGSAKVTYVVVPFLLATVFFITHRIAKYFEYDSDGLQVVIINRGLLISESFNYREHRVEFEKHHLKGYKFNDYFFYKSLVIYLDSKSHKPKETFNITLVNRKKRRYIRQSLSKIIKKNKTLKEQA